MLPPGHVPLSERNMVNVQVTRQSFGFCRFLWHRCLVQTAP